MTKPVFLSNEWIQNKFRNKIREILGLFSGNGVIWRDVRLVQNARRGRWIEVKHRFLIYYRLKVFYQVYLWDQFSSSLVQSTRETSNIYVYDRKQLCSSEFNFIEPNKQAMVQEWQSKIKIKIKRWQNFSWFPQSQIRSSSFLFIYVIVYLLNIDGYRAVVM